LLDDVAHAIVKLLITIRHNLDQENLMPISTCLLLAAKAIQSKDVKVDTDINLRTRFERVTDKDFYEPDADNFSSFLTRFEPGFTVSYNEWQFRTLYQFAHSQNWEESGDTSTTNSDLSEFYFRHTRSGQAWTIGRQKFKIGDGRLMETTDWGNVARTFDGLHFRNGKFQAFFVKDAIVRNRPKDARLAGFSLNHAGGESAYFFKSDVVSAGNTAIHTLDRIWRSDLAGYKTNLEIAVQFGESGGKEHSAYAAHADLTIPVSPKFRVMLEGNIASGGQSSNHSKTFDELSGSTHSKYGYTDMIGWRNMKELALKTRYTFSPDTNLMANIHGFWLFDAADGFYRGAGLNRGTNGNFIDPTGMSGTHLGTELNLELSHNFGWSDMKAGVAMFDPGSFIKNLNGGSAERQMYFYAQLTFKF